MQLHDGMEVLINTGGPDCPARIDHRVAPNRAIECGKYVHVRFARSGAWVEPDSLRPMTIEDHRCVHGLRFCDWQERLWYTLVFRFAHSFSDLNVPIATLRPSWDDGWSVGATATRIAATQGWVRFPPRGIPAYAQPLVATLVDDEDSGTLAHYA